jgi:hypothetical protein
MVTITRNGITLSAGAVANGWPMPVYTPPVFPGRGDFAQRLGGRIRRNERRARIAFKQMGLN